MKFKVKRSSALGKKFTALQVEIDAATNAAKALANELGFSKWREGRRCVAGGISAFHAERKPEGWGYAFTRKYPRDFFPKRSLKANKQIVDRIDALPVVEYEDLNKLIRYDGFKTNELAHNGDGSSKISFMPQVIFKENFVLVSVPEYVKYKPVKDMIEITVTEYRKLGGGNG